MKYSFEYRRIRSVKRNYIIHLFTLSISLYCLQLNNENSQFDAMCLIKLTIDQLNQIQNIDSSIN